MDVTLVRVGQHMDLAAVSLVVGLIAKTSMIGLVTS